MKLPLLLSIASIVLCSSCAVHHAASGNTANTQTTQGATDTVSGNWKLDKIEITGAAGAQDTNNASHTADLTQRFKGSVINLNSNGTYKLSVNGQNDAGTWKINSSNEMEITSKLIKTSTLLPIVSQDRNNMVVKYVNGEQVMVFTFVRGM